MIKIWAYLADKADDKTIDDIIAGYTQPFNRGTSPYSHVEIEFSDDRCFSATLRDKDGGTRFRRADQVLKNRERWQCGAELIGAGSATADVELIALATEALRGLGLKKVELKLSHAGLTKALLKSFGLSVGEQTRIFDLILDGEYRYDEGYGSSRSGGDLSLQRFFGSRSYLAVKGTAFETFSEFRVGSGQVYGGGILGAMPIGKATFQASAMFYKHTQNDRPSLLDLNQARVNVSLEVPIGRDPGLAGGGN